MTAARKLRLLMVTSGIVLCFVLGAVVLVWGVASGCRGGPPGGSLNEPARTSSTTVTSTTAATTATKAH